MYAGTGIRMRLTNECANESLKWTNANHRKIVRRSGRVWYMIRLFSAKKTQRLLVGTEPSNRQCTKASQATGIAPMPMNGDANIPFSSCVRARSVIIQPERRMYWMSFFGMGIGYVLVLVSPRFVHRNTAQRRRSIASHCKCLFYCLVVVVVWPNEFTW